MCDLSTSDYWSHKTNTGGLKPHNTLFSDENMNVIFVKMVCAATAIVVIIITTLPTCKAD